MTHNKSKHCEKVVICDRFLRGQCNRREVCWFRHDVNDLQTETDSQQLDFQQVPQMSIPPDQIPQIFQMMNNLYAKMEEMERRTRHL